MIVPYVSRPRMTRLDLPQPRVFEGWGPRLS